MGNRPRTVSGQQVLYVTAKMASPIMGYINEGELSMAQVVLVHLCSEGLHLGISF